MVVGVGPRLRLADWLDGALSAASLPPQLPLQPHECADSAATFLALSVLDSAVAQQRPPPAWLEATELRRIFRATLAEQAADSSSCEALQAL